MVHQRRVAHLASTIAREMGLLEEQIDTLQMAATIHEVGKISVPLDILSKPGSLLEPHPDNPDRFPASRKTKWVWLPIGVVRRRDFSGSKNLGSRGCCRCGSFPLSLPTFPGNRKVLDELSQHKGSFYDPSLVNAFTRLYSGNMFGNFFPSQGSC